MPDILVDDNEKYINEPFYLAEKYYRTAGQVIGLRPKKNVQLQNLYWLERKMHRYHDTPYERTEKILKPYQNKSFLDTPFTKVRKRLKRLGYI